MTSQRSITGKYNQNTFEVVAEECESLKMNSTEWRVCLSVNGKYVGAIPMIGSESGACGLLQQLRESPIEEFDTVQNWFFASAVQK